MVLNQQWIIMVGLCCSVFLYSRIALMNKDKKDYIYNPKPFRRPRDPVRQDHYRSRNDGFIPGLVIGVVLGLIIANWL